MDPVGPACPCFRGFECLILTLPCKGFVLSRSQLLFPVWLDMHPPARQAEREQHEKMWLRQKQAFNCSDRGQCADTAERGHPNIAVRIFTLATVKPFQSGKINAMSTKMDCLSLSSLYKKHGANNNVVWFNAAKLSVWQPDTGRPAAAAAGIQTDWHPSSESASLLPQLQLESQICLL